MSDNVIKEFLVSLGFKSDGLDSFTDTLTGVQAKAVALGEAMYDTAKGVAEAIARMATGFDQLYWQTQRLGSSAADIKAYGYAISQLGGSAEGAQSALENIAEFMRATPGSAGWLKGLGVTDKDFGNAQAVARDLSRAFQQMPYAQAKQYAAVIGIDPLTLQAMDRDTGKYEDRYKDFAKSLGINLDEVAGKSNEFMTNLREMKAEFGLMFDLAGYKVLEWILPKLEALAGWVREMSSGHKIAGIGGQFQALANDIGDLINALSRLAHTQFANDFATAMVRAIDDITKVFTHFINMVTDILNGDWKGAWREANAKIDNFSQPDSSAPSAPRSGGGFKNGVGGAVGYFMSQGFSADQAAGIKAGILAESGGDPNAVNKKSGAYGLGQWLGSRKARLFARYGRNPTASQQLEFLAWELNGGDRGGAAVHAAGSSVDALRAYIGAFMRPHSGYETSSDLSRGYAALGNPFQATLGVGGRGGVTINQKTDIHANGGNSRDVANDVASHQDGVNQRLVATAGVFAY